MKVYQLPGPTLEVEKALASVFRDLVSGLSGTQMVIIENATFDILDEHDWVTEPTTLSIRRNQPPGDLPFYVEDLIKGEDVIHSGGNGEPVVRSETSDGLVVFTVGFWRLSTKLDYEQKTLISNRVGEKAEDWIVMRVATPASVVVVES